MYRKYGLIRHKLNQVTFDVIVVLGPVTVIRGMKGRDMS